MLNGRISGSSRLTWKSPPWNTPYTGTPSARPTATQTSNRGDSYSWQRIASQPSSRTVRARSRGGVARYDATSLSTRAAPGIRTSGNVSAALAASGFDMRRRRTRMRARRR